ARGGARDGGLGRYQVLAGSAFTLAAVLAALNRRYFSSFEFKRTRALLEALELAPPGLADRLESLFTLDRDASTRELEALVVETQALLREHVPGLNVELERPRGTRQQRWGEV